jgi:multiple sugar transport system substrate-binding protein
MLSTAALLLTGCSSGSSSDKTASAKTITYQLWDTSQQPAYQACATAFHKQTGITVKIQQVDYNNYFTGLATNFAAGAGPDVFTDVTSDYPQYAAAGQIVNLSPLIKRDHVDMNAFLPVTGKNWVENGKIYGLQKDLDAVGVAYNTKDVAAANISPATMASLTWNPTTGGTFEKVIKELTLDSSGRNGLDPGFDKSKVVRYGSDAPNPSEISGHSDWGNLMLSTGAQLLHPNPFGTKWNFSQSGVVQTLAWYQRMIAGGFMRPASLNTSLSQSSLFDAGKIALTTAGSWNAGTFAAGKTPITWVNLPTGPAGLRTYSNSLGDSINANSKNKAQAWDWVKYMGTPACQNVVASYAVVFPALKVSNAKAAAAYAKKGINMTPLLKTLNTPGDAIALPVANKYAQVEQLGDAALQSILINGKPASSTLSALNDSVKALYTKS